MAEQKHKGFCQIRCMDPREPLLAASDRASYEFLEQWDHLTECASVGPQDDPESGYNRPCTFPLGLERLIFPRDGNRCQEVVPRGRVFGQFFVFVESVVPDCRRAEQGKPLRLVSAYGIHNVARRAYPAVKNCLFLLVCPPRKYRCTRKIYHCVICRDSLLP